MAEIDWQLVLLRGKVRSGWQQQAGLGTAKDEPAREGKVNAYDADLQL